MTDEELSQWHARMRELQTPQTLLSELRSDTKVKRDKEEPPKGFNADEYS